MINYKFQRMNPWPKTLMHSMMKSLKPTLTLPLNQERRNPKIQNKDERKGEHRKGRHCKLANWKMLRLKLILA